MILNFYILVLLLFFIIFILIVRIYTYAHIYSYIYAHARINNIYIWNKKNGILNNIYTPFFSNLEINALKLNSSFKI